MAGRSGLTPDLFDDDLKEQLQAALDSDPNISPYSLKADVVERQAQLHGIVDTLSEKKRAEDLARNIQGIEDVDSAIAISTDGPVTDKDVEMEVSEELQAHPDVGTKRIGAKISRGVARLVGTTENPSEVEAAKQAAARARGVTKVLSEIKIRDKNAARKDPHGEKP